VNPQHLGSDFDDFLREEGLLEEAEAAARERIDRARRQAADAAEAEVAETER
jgi:hypothetical protein